MIETLSLAFACVASLSAVIGVPSFLTYALAYEPGFGEGPEEDDGVDYEDEDHLW